MKCTEEVKDSKMRVAVILTDCNYVIIGKSPQNVKKSEHCCDLFKGHALIGESLEDAAVRELYEESGFKVEVSSLKKLTEPFPYLNGDSITFFMVYMKDLPDASTFECKSFFEQNGKKCPEIAQYMTVSLDELPKYLYWKLSRLVVENSIIEKIKSNATTEYVFLGYKSMKWGDGEVVYCPYIPQVVSNEEAEEHRRKNRAGWKYATVKRSNPNNYYKCKTGKIVEIDISKNRYCLRIDTMNYVSSMGYHTLIGVPESSYKNVWFNADDLEDFVEYDENGDLKK